MFFDLMIFVGLRACMNNSIEKILITVASGAVRCMNNSPLSKLFRIRSIYTQ